MANESRRWRFVVGGCRIVLKDCQCVNPMYYIIIIHLFSHSYFINHFPWPWCPPYFEGMKFAKRLEAEAERHWLKFYIDYKGLKKCIKKDIDDEDISSSSFQDLLHSELEKVSTFYQSQEDLVQFTMKRFVKRLGKISQMQCGAADELVSIFHDLKRDVLDLNKFVVLNYVAVIKAVKKRNKRIVTASLNAQRIHMMKPMEFLESQYFFTSLKLAGIKTRLDLIAQELPGAEHKPMSLDEAKQEYSCPICLSLLNGPVVLSCSHIFCWGCLVALCSSVKRQSVDVHRLDGNKEQEQALWDDHEGESNTAATFQCPCCRKEEILDLDRLVVDSHLDKYLKQMESSMCVPMDISTPEEQRKYLLPPQRSEFQNKITLCLDLDGTLVTTLNPKRAPVLPESAVSYVVGVGGKLNPGGIFVIERPGLGDFLRRAACLCEVVLFTAGLEDYAAPILDEIERRYGKVFHYRLYRPATSHSDVYPCVKDLSKLGRKLEKCILVDDTPLAFFRQPDHGVPVLQYRGDIDDRLLSEAVEPLLFCLIKENDVPMALRRRFNMKKWFLSQGLESETIEEVRKLVSKPIQVSASTSHLPTINTQRDEETIYAHILPSETMMVMDFDKTLTDWDAAERLVDEISPELTSLLSSVESLANFIPMTNTVLSEMHRRGVTRDKIVQVLTNMGKEVPKGSIALLRYAISCGVDCRILSDCNEVFIGHILSSAKIRACFTEIITNSSGFERTRENLFSHSHQKLVVKPRHDASQHGSHGCPTCPDNLCKGKEIQLMRAKRKKKTKRIIYIGDGANDYCAVKALGRNDIVLARQGLELENFIINKSETILAQVVFWNDHDELLQKMKLYLSY